MNRTTIDFGIDLGTTNSAIAILNGVSTQIIKNNRDADITPSAVWLRKNGETYVGWEAKNRSREHPEEAYLEFKRLMGTDHQYRFKSTGTARKPEELSAEVLKSLRGDVQQKTGEVVEAAVITVPAAFELHQCAATRKAAELAGLKHSPLLQEPVAAALAHGFQVNQAKAYWLVYDFGGGTFDAAIIKAEDGTINVVNHGGDASLGGSDIDWAIVDHLLVPRLVQQYGWTDFNRANAGRGGKWRQAFAGLKWNAEELKIALSRRPKATLDTVTFETPEGEEIEFETEVSQEEMIAVATPFILRSVEICKKVLAEKKLGKQAIEKMILVGGPTLAPYFREILASNLGIPLDHSVDPLTVVARGAAIFAGTQKLSPGAAAPVPRGEYRLELAASFKPIGTDSAPMVGGKVVGASAQDFAGFTLELVNAKTQWRSGKVALSPDGVFMTTLHAAHGERNTFVVELFDGGGRKQQIAPDTLTYTIGAVVEEQPLVNSMGIALADNKYAKYFEKGHGLPLRATHDFKTILPLRQGQSGAVLRVPVVEGENEKADRNRMIGELVISPEKIRRDLPVRSDVEITLKIDEARIVTVTAFFPLLDEEFVGTIELIKCTPDPEFLRRDFEAEIKRFREVKSDAANAGGETAGDLIHRVEESPLIQEVRDALAAAKGDPDAAAKCEKRLLELKLKLDEAADALQWPALVAEVREWLDYLQRVVKQNATPQQNERAAALAGEAKELMAAQNAERLRRKLDQIKQLHWEVVFAQPAFWVYQLQQLEEKKEQMVDPQRAARLFDQGGDCIAKNNATGLQNVVRQLWDLLPNDVVEATRRGYQSSLVK